MPVSLLSYISTVIILLGLDFTWFSLSLNAVYKPKLGEWLLDKPNFLVAALFYLLYAVGIIVFSVLPALEQASWFRALWSGALFGLIAYGTYDLTNLATLRNWPISVSIIDMLWGTFAATITAVASYFIVRYFKY